MRTSVKQAEYVVEHHKNSNFFNETDENVSAQQAQHEILLELSKAAVADIYSKLRDIPSQDHPLIVTASGSVVDGNRRLAAMRELYSIDPTRYATFDYIEIAVLPAGASNDDLVEMETVIQIQPDLKSDYGWIEEALGLERQLNTLNWPIEKVSHLWQESKKVLLERIDALEIARDYLNHIGRPGEYGEIEDAQQAIATFRETSSGTGFAALAPRKKRANQLVMFSVLKSTEIGQRKYLYAKNIDAITDRVIDLFEIPTGDDINPEADPSSPFSGLPPDSSDVEPAIIEVLSDLDNCDEVAGLAEEALIEIESQRRSQKKGNQLLVAATQALTKLQEVQKVNLKPETFQQSAVKLLNLIAEAVALIEYLMRESPGIPSKLDLAEKNQLKPAVALSKKWNV
jgi:hypothetical protein